ncbi:hypothetical protein [Priestia koreensis]|uniref:hypothetical protein n=1 Tax=Priestia koreensis TaxID=284581 RepID=UPI00203DDD65|nr:hypothetical protein [Priestia koreensis]MCM3006718.1 hypothetical protein [Priestia koreensis]
MIFSIMNKLINTGYYNRDIYLTEKNLYISHIQELIRIAEEDKASEVAVYLQKMMKIVQNHMDNIKDGYFKLDKLTEKIKGDYSDINEIAQESPDEWKNHSLSYGKGEIVFIWPQGYDELIQMDIYLLSLFSVTDNLTYRFKECYIGFSNKDLEPYINFDIWIERKMGELEKSKNLNTLNSLLSDIKKHLINLYRVKDTYDLIPDVKRYGLPPSSEVLKNFIKKFNKNKDEIYLVKAGFKDITEDLIVLAQTKQLLINLKDDDVKEFYSDGYDKKLDETEKKLIQLTQTLRIKDEDLLNLSDVIKKYEKNGV